LTWNGSAWAPATPGAGYTDEQAQDAIGTILADSGTIDFTYDDATPSITAIVKDSSITEGKQVLADVTTHNVSASAHGYAPKHPGDANYYLAGDGTWKPTGSGGIFFFLASGGVIISGSQDTSYEFEFTGSGGLTVTE